MSNENNKIKVKNLNSEEDKLNRNKDVENIASLLKSSHSPFTLSINSAWGTGKTFFIKQLEKKLIEDNVICCYIDAWKNDFLEDPFLVILSSFEKLIKQVTDENKQDIKDKLDAVKDKSISILKVPPP